MPAETSNNASALSRSTSDEQSFAKANEAIAIRPKRGKMTLLSRRIFNALVYHSQRQGVDRPVYSLALSELIGDARFNSNNTELLKSHLRDMQATTIEWSTGGAGTSRWTSTQLLGTVHIEEQGRGHACIISWKYSDEIKERLVKPVQYTRILLEMSSQMRSYPAAALYELGARYLTSPSRLTMREDVLWWAAVLTGRSDLKEVEYRFFKRDTIVKAMAEVEALCDAFSLELIEHKRGRRIEELQFRVVPKPQRRFDAMDDPAHNVFDLELVGRLIALGIKTDEAQEIYAVTDEGLLRGAVEVAEQRQRNSSLPPLQSPAAYFRDALKKGYGGVTARAEKPQAALPPSQVLNEAERQQRIVEMWVNERAARAKAMYGEMMQDMQQETRTRFEVARLDHLASPIAKAWKKDGPASRLAATSFFRWLAEDTWPEEPTDKVMLDYALQKGVTGV